MQIPASHVVYAILTAYWWDDSKQQARQQAAGRLARNPWLNIANPSLAAASSRKQAAGRLASRLCHAYNLLAASNSR